VAVWVGRRDESGGFACSSPSARVYMPRRGAALRCAGGPGPFRWGSACGGV
jgi:hypothetical protein